MKIPTVSALPADRIAAAVEVVPTLASALLKLASKVARGVALPATVSFPGLDYAAQRELEGLFGVQGRRNGNGRFSITLPEPLREPSAWREALEYFGLSHEAEEDGKDIFGRLKLLLPETAEALDFLAERDDVSRFVADRENGRDWMRLFRHVVEKRLLRNDYDPITLSQLGSDCFGDSKKLRSGALRRQLAQILGVFGDMDPSDERAVFARFGIIDNPYTTSATIFAPIIFWCRDVRKPFDFPYLLFRQGLACQLPLETVGAITKIEWLEDSNPLITTSENAAPFAGLVRRGIPCLYTEGYPNTCVTGLLSMFHAKGVKCVHEGDADLDGFRIADEVAGCIPVVRVAASDALARAKTDDGIPLTEVQSARTRAFLEKHSDFRYASDIRRLLARGRWIEQESFGKIR